MNDLVERLKRYVAIPSLSKHESALADQVQRELVDAGLTVLRSGNNVWCEIGDAPRPRLLLNSHLDTVPAGGAWSRYPWTPTEIDGRIYGLGANDAKGCATAMIAATLSALQLLRAGGALGGTLVLALTAEEENTGAGLNTIVDRLRPIDAALVGEPTDLVPMTAQRGLLILRAVANGRTGHPANTPMNDGANAIFAAADAIQALQSFDWGPAHPRLGRAHAHVTQIAGGVARNVVPDACEFYIDIRTTPIESHDALHARLAAALPCELHTHSKRLVPVETPANSPIVQAVLRALPGAQPGGSRAMSDMVFLAGIPTVKIGPGHSPRSHTPDEFINAAELEAGARAYENIVLGYFGAAAGGPDVVSQALGGRT